MADAEPTLDNLTFILGSGRSGTSLLRVMLAGHPGLFSPPEMVIAPFETMAEREAWMKVRYWEKGGLRRALMDLRGIDVEEAKQAVAALGERTTPEVYAELSRLVGGRMIVDKCPHLSIAGDTSLLERTLRWFPDAHYLWIVRHPGSVIRSFQNMPMAEVMLQGFDGGAEKVWTVANATTQAFLATVPEDRWAMVRYEDLVRDPRTEMERACAAMGVPFDEATLTPYEGDRMREGPRGARAIGDPNLASRGSIQPELATRWLEGFDPRTLGDEARALAEALGYDLSAENLPPIARLSDAMGALLQTAQELEAGIDIPMDLDAVEGRRFLLRMLSASVDTWVEQWDADRPAFHHSEGSTRKMFADCPDADYLRAPIQTGAGRVYRLRGRMPEGTVYAGVLLYGKGGRIGNRLRDDQLGADADGSFELRISTEPQEGVWLEASGDETAVLVRQYFTDRAAQRPLELDIELLSPTPAPNAPLDAVGLTTRVEKSTRMLRSIFERTTTAYRMGHAIGLNTFAPIGGEQLFPTPDNEYQVAWYRFGADQVLMVRGRLPKARYFSFTLCNAWLESFDYERHRCVLNHTQIEADADGRFEVCLAHEDPAHPNWLDTGDHHAGWIIARSLLPEGDLHPLETQVMYRKEWEAVREGRGPGQ